MVYVVLLDGAGQEVSTGGPDETAVHVARGEVLGNAN